jgi:SAM-dependent methyltransferase
VPYKPQPEWRVLDVGCGFANNLVPFADIGCECHGVDLHPEMAATVQEIMDVMKSNYISAQKFVIQAIPDLVRNPIKFSPENQYAVMTDPALHKSSHKEILEVILK